MLFCVCVCVKKIHCLLKIKTFFYSSSSCILLIIDILSYQQNSSVNFLWHGCLHNMPMYNCPD